MGTYRSGSTQITRAEPVRPVIVEKAWDSDLIEERVSRRGERFEASYRRHSFSRDPFRDLDREEPDRRNKPIVIVNPEPSARPIRSDHRHKKSQTISQQEKTDGSDTTQSLGSSQLHQPSERKEQPSQENKDPPPNFSPPSPGSSEQASEPISHSEETQVREELDRERQFQEQQQRIQQLQHDIDKYYGRTGDSLVRHKKRLLLDEKEVTDDAVTPDENSSEEDSEDGGRADIRRKKRRVRDGKPKTRARRRTTEKMEKVKAEYQERMIDRRARLYQPVGQNLGREQFPHESQNTGAGPMKWNRPLSVQKTSEALISQEIRITRSAKIMIELINQVVIMTSHPIRPSWREIPWDILAMMFQARSLLKASRYLRIWRTCWCNGLLSTIWSYDEASSRLLSEM